MGNNRIRNLHKEILQHMEQFYKSYRTRCLTLMFDGEYFNIDYCKILQPFTVKDRVELLWESKSLKFFEEERNLPDSIDFLSPLSATECSIGGEKIILRSSDLDFQITSDYAYGPSWQRRYRNMSTGVVFRNTMQVDRSVSNVTMEDIREEIRFHPVSPFQHSSDLAESLGGREVDFLKRSVMEVVAPFWARITDVVIDGRKIKARYEIPQNMEQSVKIWKNIETNEGDLFKEEIGFMKTDEPQHHGKLGKYYGEYVIPKEIDNAKRVSIVLNIDNKFGIGWERKEIGPSKLILWSLLEEQEIKSGRLKSMIEGEKGNYNIEQFEYAVGLLLTSFGFRVALTGKLFEPGPDILAIGPNENTIIVVECGRAKYEQKLSACQERLEFLRREYPNYTFLGVVFTSLKISQEVKNNLQYQSVTLVDGSDIDILLEIVKRRPDPSIILNSLRGGWGGVSWKRL